MTKAELIAAVATKAHLQKAQAEAVLTALRVVAVEQLRKEGKIEMPGFGRFVVVHRAARKGKNPKTGAPITIPARKAVTFKTAKAVKDQVQGK